MSAELSMKKCALASKEAELEKKLACAHALEVMMKEARDKVCQSDRDASENRKATFG